MKKKPLSLYQAYVVVAFLCVMIGDMKGFAVINMQLYIWPLLKRNLAPKSMQLMH